MKGFLEENEHVFNPTWPPGVADRCLTNSLWLAPRIVARYLVLWAFLVGLGENES
jgi:hypothetical protein